MKHVGPISGVATWRDRYVATAGYDNQVVLWDATTRRPIHRVFHDHLANQCAFSADGRYLASASSDYTARLWEVPSLRLTTVFNGHSDDVEMVAFSPGGDRVATCSRDWTVRVFDLQGGLVSVLEGHGADVISVSWLPGGTELVSSSDDGTIRRWDVDGGRELKRIGMEGVETDTIAVTGYGHVYAGDDEGRITIVADDETSSVQAHSVGIKRLVYSDAHQLLVSLSYDRSAVIWARRDGALERLRSTSLPDVVWPRSAAFLGDSHLVFGTFGSTYATYDFLRGEWDTGGIERSSALNAVLNRDGTVYAVGDAGVVYVDGSVVADHQTLCNFLVPLGSRVLTGGQAGRVLDATTGETLHQNRSPINCGVAFEREGRPHAAIGCYTGEVLVFTVDHGAAGAAGAVGAAGAGAVQLVGSARVHDNAIKGLAASGEELFSVCATGAAAITRLGDLETVARLPDAHDRIANGCAVVGDGTYASVSRDRKLRIWNGATKRTVDTPHRNSIKCIAASRDGRFVATGSYVGLVAVYDLVRDEWVQVTRPTAAGISCLAAGSAPDEFLASSYDGSVYTVTATASLVPA